MEIVSRYVREQQRYTKNNLKSIFSMDESAVERFIKNLKAFGVLKSVKNNEDQLEMSDLVDDDIEISEQNNNILNKNSHDEIEKLKQQNDDLTIQLKEKTDKLRDSHATSQKNLDNNLALSNQLFILKKEKKDLYKEIESLKQQNKVLIELLKESKQTYTYKKTRKNGEYKK